MTSQQYEQDEPQHWSPFTAPTAPLDLPMPPAPLSSPSAPTMPYVPAATVATGVNQPTMNLAPPGPGELLRFGPGVPVPVATADMSQATALWRGEAQPPDNTPRRRRRLLSWLLPLLVLITVIAILLWQRSGPSLAITNAAVTVASSALTCDGTANVNAEMHTNGNAGTITYRWRRSDGTVSDPLRQQVTRGSTDVHVVLLWSFHGQGTMNATATLEVLSPNQMTASATFAYTCPKA